MSEIHHNLRTNASSKNAAYLRHPSLLPALRFCLDWPSLVRAARLLIDLPDEIDGERYELLVPAAEALSVRFPLAATLALRAMINFTLSNARSKRYGYAAQHLSEGEGLDCWIEDYGTFEPHATYIARLKRDHGRKTGFWGHIT
jgi:hypothetical protein